VEWCRHFLITTVFLFSEKSTWRQPQEWLKHVGDYNTIKVHQQNYSVFVGLEYILCSSLTFSVEPFKCQVSTADVDYSIQTTTVGQHFPFRQHCPVHPLKVKMNSE
jgi:hypothetical protein